LFVKYFLGFFDPCNAPKGIQISDEKNIFDFSLCVVVTKQKVRSFIQNDADQNNKSIGYGNFSNEY
jgi:hypothetical protein